MALFGLILDDLHNLGAPSSNKGEIWVAPPPKKNLHPLVVFLNGP